MARFIAAVGVGLVALGAVGCGGRATAPVEATVTLDGKPFPVGTLVVTSEDGSYSDNGRIVNGHATVPHAPVGRVKLAVLPQRVTPVGPPGRAGGAPKPGGGGTDPGQKLPDRYKDPNQSGVVAEVASGPNTVEVSLTTRPAAGGR